MSKAIPLGSTLGIQFVDIIIGDIFRQGFNSMYEFLATKARLFWNVQWQTKEI